MPRLLQQKAVERLLRRELPILSDIVVGAWADYMDYPAEIRIKHSPRTRASAVHDHMVSRARAAFDFNVNTRCMEQGGLFFVLLRDRIALRFKKLDDELRSCNIPTQQSIDFVRQELDLPGFKQITNLQAGYQLNPMQTKVAGAYLACPSGNYNQWVIELNTGQAADSVVDFPRAPAPVAGPRLVAKIQTPKKETGDGRVD